MKKNIEVTCECQPKKLSVFDEVFLKDGTKGTVVEFDKSPIYWGWRDGTALDSP